MQMRSGAYRWVTLVFLWLIATGSLETRSSQSAAARSSAAQLSAIWLNFADFICDRGASADLRSPDSYDYKPYVVIGQRARSTAGFASNIPR